MRCLALANYWQKSCGKAIVIIKRTSVSLIKRVQSVCEYIPIDPDISELADVEFVAEEALKERAFVILDGYQFNTEYQYYLFEQDIPFLYVDDYAHLDYYYASIIFNQNVDAHHLGYNAPEGTTFLLGTQYVLLRSEFFNYSSLKRTFPKEPISIAVSFGGSDPSNMTEKIVNSIIKLPDKCDITVVLGPEAPCRQNVIEAFKATGIKGAVVENVSNMAELLCEADIFISAGGSTCWEACFLGLPMVLVAVADNQQPIVDGLAKHNAAINLGWYEEFDPREFNKVLLRLLEKREERENLSTNARKLVDGKGVHRVCEHIKKLDAQCDY